jgi:hypothetical protein
MTPDAATWAKVLCNGFGVGRWDNQTQEARSDWLAVAETALSLHTQRLEAAVAHAALAERARCAQLVRDMAWIARDMDAPQSKIVSETLAQVVKELLRQQ